MGDVIMRKAVFLVGICVGFGFLIGFLVGYFSIPSTPVIFACEAGEHERDFGEGTVSERLMREINPENIKKHLR